MYTTTNKLRVSKIIITHVCVCVRPFYLRAGAELVCVTPADVRFVDVAPMRLASEAAVLKYSFLLTTDLPF